MQIESPARNRILRKPAVVDRVGLSDTTIWRLVQEGLFPAPLKLSANAIGWIEADVEAWIAQRAEACGPRHTATSLAAEDAHRNGL